MIRFVIFCCFLISIPSFANSNDALNINNYEYSQTTYGSTGLIQMPTARFSRDGEFLFGMSTEAPYNRLFAKAQFFPWLEAVVRYTEGEHLPYNVGSSQTWKDKGIDLKIRLSNETDFLPALALGLQDIGGTGTYSGEYIVANKRVNNLDLSLGLGWGLFSRQGHISNPIGWLDENRKIRAGYGSYGGNLTFDRYFSGKDVSFFGGIEYFTPIPNLSLKAEYDTTKHQQVGRNIDFRDPSKGSFKIDSDINIALNYIMQVSERDKVDLSLGFVRGNTIYANLAVHSNLNFLGTPKVVMGAESLRESNFESYSSLNKDWKKYLVDTVIWEMGNVGFVTHNIIFNESELIAEISQGRFKETSQMFDLASRVLANNAPRNIKKITIINIDQGIETIRSSIDREVLIAEVSKGSLNEKFLEFNKLEELSAVSTNIENEYLYPNFYWELKPHMLGTLQHQEKFYFWQLEALIHTEYSIKKGLYLTTDVGINISNNYDDYSYHIPDGELYHVRQDRRLYLTEGETGLRRMALDYLVDIHSNLKAKLSLGYLEWMYGGIGGEILYLPDDKRWGIGFETYWVKQRDFDQKFSFKDYETLTGFLTYYQDIPFYDMRMKLSMGKFLAKDVGAHIDVSRRFNTGARVGAIVALTDCDSACVGEGSFNKWIYFELPMDLFYTQSTTRAKTGYSWSPLTKDAGARIESGGLYNLMMNATDEVDSLRQKPWSLKKIISGFSIKSRDKT